MTVTVIKMFLSKSRTLYVPASLGVNSLMLMFPSVSDIRLLWTPLPLFQTSVHSVLVLGWCCTLSALGNRTSNCSSSPVFTEISSEEKQKDINHDYHSRQCSKCRYKISIMRSKSVLSILCKKYINQGNKKPKVTAVPHFPICYNL